MIEENGSIHNVDNGFPVDGNQGIEASEMEMNEVGTNEFGTTEVNANGVNANQVNADEANANQVNANEVNANEAEGTENSSVNSYENVASTPKQEEQPGARTVQYQNYPLTQEVVQEPVKAAKTKKTKEKKKGNFFTRMLACASLGIVFGVCGGLGFYAVAKTTGMEFGKSTAAVVETTTDTQNRIPSTNVLTNTDAQNSGVVLTGGDSVKVVTSDVSDMVEQVMPAMVSIMNTYTSTTSIWGRSYSQESKASGSGIIVAQSDEELIMVTNHHVVEDAKKLEVTFIDGSTAEAQIKGSDADMDLAVIAIPLDDLDASTLKAITVVKLGDSESARLGSPVIAIGNALGYGQSVTGGYLSAVNREITFDDGTTGKFLQTDAAINPGNSGGALLNLDGELIGINSSKIGGDSIDGIGFAIPISNAKPIIEELMSKQTKHKNASGKSGYLGIEPVSINDEAAYMYNYPKGVFVRNVEDNSPAANGGMLAGDIITALDGDKISSYEDLAEALTYHEPGTTISVVVQRLNGGYFDEVELNITLGERPDAQ